MSNDSPLNFLSSFFGKLGDIVLTKEIIEDITNSLLGIDILTETVQKILKPIKEKLGLRISPDFLVASISKEMIKILKPHSKPMEIDALYKPQVVLMCGMNGVGKTSTIGKMAYSLSKYEWSVAIGACDTFRAAATDQLSAILQKNNLGNVKLITSKKLNGDPRSVAYKSYDVAKESDVDVLLIDTAGRVYNKTNLMEELSGIKRTLSKKNILAPHNIILIIDGNTGKNAIKQVAEFSNKIGKISGLIVTKLDGQARCGVILSIVDQFGITIHGLTSGENIDDLHDFIPENFVKMLLKIRN